MGARTTGGTSDAQRFQAATRHRDYLALRRSARLGDTSPRALGLSRVGCADRYFLGRSTRAKGLEAVNLNQLLYRFEEIVRMSATQDEQPISAAELHKILEASH